MVFWRPRTSTKSVLCADGCLRTAEGGPGGGGHHHDCGSQAHNCTAVQPGLRRDAVAFRTEHEVATVRRAVLLYTAPQTLLLWAPAVTLTSNCHKQHSSRG